MRLQVVKGAPKEGGDQVEGLFDRARQAGARQGTSEDLPGGAKGGSAGNSSAFTGASRTLAGSSADEPPPAAAASTPPSVEAQGPQEHVITFWRNNIFTVNDGAISAHAQQRSMIYACSSPHACRF